jgi:hypothetical protein
MMFPLLGIGRWIRENVGSRNAPLSAKRSRGFHPRRCGSPDTITPEQVLRHHRSQRRSGMGGQLLSPLSSYHYFVYHFKRISPEPFFFKDVPWRFFPPIAITLYYRI